MEEPPKPLAYLLRMRERHGDVFPLRLVGGQPTMVVGDPELAAEVFRAPDDLLCAGEGNRRAIGWLLGEHSVVLLDGQRHLDHRRLLLPPFHGKNLERHAEAVREQAERWLDSWPLDREEAAVPRLRALTLNVIAGVLFGDSGERRFRTLRDALLELQVPPTALAGRTPSFRHTYRNVERLIEREVASRRKQGEADAADDLLGVLLEARLEDGSLLSDEEVRDELMTIVVTGTESTAGSLAWALDRLARAPVALARVTEAVDAEDRSYVDAVIQETLRMRPTVPMLARLVKRPIELGGRSIDPGVLLAVSVLVIHHRADVYPDPMTFRPERFLERPPGTYTWIPFGGGTRRCIGRSFAMLEMRTVLVALLARFTVTTVRSKTEGMLNRANTMVPAEGAQVVLAPRDG
jgi:cytochrome P450 family 135